MTLHIKDEKADRLARELAQATGETLTEAVTRAIEERLGRFRRRSEAEIEARRRAMIEVVEEIKKLPVLDPRSPDEIIGYDEHGLPS
jgi:antitoxin VapB